MITTRLQLTAENNILQQRRRMRLKWFWYVYFLYQVAFNVCFFISFLNGMYMTIIQIKVILVTSTCKIPLFWILYKPLYYFVITKIRFNEHSVGEQEYRMSFSEIFKFYSIYYFHAFQATVLESICVETTILQYKYFNAMRWFGWYTTKNTINDHKSLIR